MCLFFLEIILQLFFLYLEFNLMLYLLLFLKYSNLNIMVTLPQVWISSQ